MKFYEVLQAVSELSSAQRTVLLEELQAGKPETRKRSSELAPPTEDYPLFTERKKRKRKSAKSPKSVSWAKNEEASFWLWDVFADASDKGLSRPAAIRVSHAMAKEQYGSTLGAIRAQHDVWSHYMRGNFSVPGQGRNRPEMFKTWAARRGI